jgi:hypothetical protein
MTHVLRPTSSDLWMNCWQIWIFWILIKRTICLACAPNDVVLARDLSHTCGGGYTSRRQKTFAEITFSCPASCCARMCACVCICLTKKYSLKQMALPLIDAPSFTLVSLSTPSFLRLPGSVPPSVNWRRELCWWQVGSDKTRWTWHHPTLALIDRWNWTPTIDRWNYFLSRNVGFSTGANYRCKNIAQQEHGQW